MIIKELIEKLSCEHHLSLEEYAFLVSEYSEQDAEFASEKANELRHKIYGNTVYIRGLIEISNFCKNDCLYCGIRVSNKDCSRYRITKNQILACCDEGYSLGFRTFVLQGGEDLYFSDEVVCDIISNIKSKYPDCAVTLSLGERTKESYKKMYDAGADRYLLRHETADKEHYEKLHPKSQTFENRMKCLQELKEIGYQVGCGFMVESPYQTKYTLAKDLKFIEEFRPEMCGIGPFIPHHATPFANESGGILELTTFLLSIIRLISPRILLPATTALGTINPVGREKGILAGANVIMPNLSPYGERKKYEIYDNKMSTGSESVQAIQEIKDKMKSIGYEVIIDRGDFKIS